MDLGGLSIDESMALAWRVNRNGNALNLDESSNQKSPAPIFNLKFTCLYVFLEPK